MKNIKTIILFIITIGMILPYGPAYMAENGDTTDTSIGSWAIRSSYSDSFGEIVTDDVYEGKQALKIVNNSVRTKDQMFVQAETKVSVKKGRTYTLEFHSKIKKAPGAWVMFNYAARYSLAPISANYDWTKFSFDYTPSDNESFEYEEILEEFNFIKKKNFKERLASGKLFEFSL